MRGTSPCASWGAGATGRSSLATVLLFTTIGPFGTFDEASFDRRFVYWGATMLATSLVAVVAVSTASALAPAEHRRSFPVLMAGLLLSCLPNTLVVAAIIPLVLGVPAPPLAELLVSVLPVGLAVGAVTWLVSSASQRRKRRTTRYRTRCSSGCPSPSAAR